MVRSLFAGEFIVTPRGIYTFAHHYYHPVKKMSAMIIGVNHYGTRKYFREVSRLLAENQFVIFEGVRPSDRIKYRSLLEKIDHLMLERALPEEKRLEKANQLFSKALRMVIDKSFIWEYTAFAKLPRNWISGDGIFWIELANDTKKLDRFIEDHLSAARKTGSAYKEKILAILRTHLVRIENGTWVTKDFGTLFGQLFGVMTHYPVEHIEMKREALTMRTFDELACRENVSSVAIKFGAYHISRLRKRLASRGFEPSGSKRLCAFPFR